MSLGWSVVDAPSGVHALPDDDLIVHTESETCFCNPTVERQAVHQQEYLHVRKLVVHNAMDGRE